MSNAPTAFEMQTLRTRVNRVEQSVSRSCWPFQLFPVAYRTLLMRVGVHPSIQNETLPGKLETFQLIGSQSLDYPNRLNSIPMLRW